MSGLSRHCGILDISQPYRAPQTVTGIALLLLIGYIHDAASISEYREATGV
jgi:hypothetical protein